jgi:hypothetical protein
MNTPSIKPDSHGQLPESCQPARAWLIFAAVLATAVLSYFVHLLEHNKFRSQALRQAQVGEFRGNRAHVVLNPSIFKVVCNTQECYREKSH